MKLNNKDILKEFLKLKWVEIKWFLKYVFPFIVGVLATSYIIGLLVCNYYNHPIKNLEDVFMLMMTGFISAFLLFIAFMLSIYTPYEWIKRNWERAKFNLYNKPK